MLRKPSDLLTTSLQVVLNCFFPKKSLSEWVPKQNLITMLTDYRSVYEEQFAGSYLYEQVLSLYSYQSIRPIVHAFKYHGYQYLGPEIIAHSQAAIQNHFQTKNYWPDLITYPPPDPRRNRKRLYHPPSELALYLGKILNVPSLEVFLKSKSTQAQATLADQERRQQSFSSVFSWKTGDYALYRQLLASNKILVIDDVISTGVTLQDLAKTLLQDFPHLHLSALVLGRNQLSRERPAQPQQACQNHA